MKPPVLAAGIVGFFFGGLLGVASQPHSNLWLVWGVLLAFNFAVAWSIRLRLVRGRRRRRMEQA